MVLAQLLLLGGSVAAAELSFTDLEGAREAGATVHGPATAVTVDGHRALQLPANAYLTLPTQGLLDPLSGSLRLRVTADWTADAPDRHTLFHMGQNEGRAHFTLFRTEGATLRFVYKSSPQDWLGVDLPIATWQPGDWHDVTATWEAIGERMAIGLQVDGLEPRWAVGGAPLREVPPVAEIGRRGPAGQFAEATISDLSLTAEALIPLPYAAGAKAPLMAQIDCAGGEEPLTPVHDCVTIWNSKKTPLPFAIGSPKHARLQEAGFKLARLVAVSETWLWGVALNRDAEGRIQLDFTDFDALVDMIRSAGLEPYVRIAYHMPRELSADPDGPNWAYSAPRDWDEWSDMVRAIVKHCNVDRKLGVRYWVMTLNEADIAVDRNDADWETICKLYEASVRAGKEVDPTIKVGGPAICRPLDGTGGEALRRFVQFCRERELPPDFVCFHCYHRPHPREFETHINRIREIVTEADPALQPEYFLDEWNQWGRDRHADDAYGAAYIAAALQYFRRAGLTKASIVSFNDVMEFTDEDKDLVVQRGPFDKTPTQAARFIAMGRAAGDVTRPCIVAHSPTGGSYTFGRYMVAVPAEGQPRLAFATGITAEYQGMDGVGFAVAVGPPGEEKLVFDQGQRAVAWEDHEVSLADFAGQTVRVEFRTDRGRGLTANGVADWASWAEPRLLVGRADEPEVAFDFIAEIEQAQTGVHQAATRFVYNDQAIARSSGLPLIKGNVVTAPYFTFLSQSRLTGNQLPVTGPGAGGIDETDAAGILATGDEHGVRALVWTFDVLGVGERDVRLRFTDLGKLLPGADSVRLRRYLIDETHTNPYHDYIEQSKPDNNGMYNLETGELQLVSDETADLAEDGSISLELKLTDFSVCLVEVEPAN
jgi:hypothetical protein